MRSVVRGDTHASVLAEVLLQPGAVTETAGHSGEGYSNTGIDSQGHEIAALAILLPSCWCSRDDSSLQAVSATMAVTAVAVVIAMIVTATMGATTGATMAATMVGTMAAKAETTTTAVDTATAAGT